MLKTTIKGVFLLAALSSTAQAGNVYTDQYQRIQDIELHEVVETEAGETEVLIAKQKMPTLLEELTKNNGVRKVGVGQVILMTTDIIALGEKIYKIVEKGRPVVNINSKPVQILPMDESGQALSPMELDGWKAPKAKKYRVKTRNYLGSSPASFEFMLIYSYGGSLRGKGKYITGAQIKTTKVDVSWGYNLDANFQVQTITNEGTSANPVAGAVLMIDYKIATVLQERRGNKTFYINGLGQTKAY